MHVYELSFLVLFYYSLIVRVGEKYLDPSFNDVSTISKLTFENKNKDKITHVYQKVRDHFKIGFIS